MKKIKSKQNTTNKLIIQNMNDINDKLNVIEQKNVNVTNKSKQINKREISQKKQSTKKVNKPIIIQNKQDLNNKLNVKNNLSITQRAVKLLQSKSVFVKKGIFATMSTRLNLPQKIKTFMKGKLNIKPDMQIVGFDPFNKLASYVKIVDFFDKTIKSKDQKQTGMYPVVLFSFYQDNKIVTNTIAFIHNNMKYVMLCNDDKVSIKPFNQAMAKQIFASHETKDKFIYLIIK